MRATLGRVEHGIGTRRGAAVVFGLALAVFAIRSIALPVIPGRDFGTYLSYYAQMWDGSSVVPMTMLYRTPLAPLVVGGSLDLAGGWGLQVVMAVLFGVSILVWTRTALVFGPRAALVTATALLLYPGYGILFHTPASEPVAATVFALWGLALARAWLHPTAGRFALVGLATAAAALARPGFQVLALLAIVPLFVSTTWRTRLAGAAAYAVVLAAVLGAWSVSNGIRFDDVTVARGSGAFLPFYRAFTVDHIVSPANGEASRELAALVQRELLDEEPYRSYEVSLEDFFERTGAREFDDVVGLSDRQWGWDSDYARVRDVGLEAVRAEPWTYARGVATTVLDELWSPLFVELPDQPNPSRTPASAAAVPRSLPVPSEGEQIPAARQGFFATTPDGHITEVWTSPTEHSLVFATAQMQRRYDAIGDVVDELTETMPPYRGSEWLTLQLSRSSKIFPPPLLWLVVGLVALGWRRPRHSGLALALAAAALLVVVSQALAVYAIVEFAVPVAPALVVLGAAGLVGATRRPSDRGGRSAAA